jgi:electron transfer flavoprotein alpha subunit
MIPRLTVPRALRAFTTRTTIRSNSTLTLIEHRNGKISSSCLPAITAAAQLGFPVTAFVAGSNSSEIASSAAKLSGVSKVLHVSNAAYDKSLPENLAPLLAETIKAGGFTHVLSAHSATGKNVIPRLGALLDAQPISDITAIESPTVFRRQIYAGNAIATVESNQAVTLLTVRGTAFPAAETGEKEAAVEEAKADPNAPQPMKWVEENLAVSARPDLATAGRVVSGGRGLKDKDNFEKLIPPLADSLGAAIGASRAAVDAGFADNSLQVGQTGKVVAPELYVAVGISGAIQHLAGMKDSKVIVAINKGEWAPG